jgi:hypothetical protein
VEVKQTSLGLPRNSQRLQHRKSVAYFSVSIRGFIPSNGESRARRFRDGSTSGVVGLSESFKADF